MTLRLAVVGASGRMGRAVVRLAAGGSTFAVVAAVSAEDVGRDAGELAGARALGVTVDRDLSVLVTSKPDVVVDFSSPRITAALAAMVVQARCALVSGTTGLEPSAVAALDAAAREVPLLWEPNMSVGVHVLSELVRQAIALLGLDFDVEIVEAHHRLKVDAPSGTALRLAEIAQKARADGAALAHGREGKPGKRPVSEIGMHAVRGGDVVGDHSVHLLGDGERIELVHRATSRDLFAHGALRAAAVIAGCPPARYRIADVVRR